MTELYVPKPGERVRVVEVSREDPCPAARVGDVLTVHCAFPSRGAPVWAFVQDELSFGGTWCRVEPVAKLTTMCAHCEGVCDPGDLYTDGMRVYCSAKCREHDLPSKYAQPPARRFCACGQELLGKRFESAFCGDCYGGWKLNDPRSIGEQRRTAPSLDARIRAAQPEAEECAWMTPSAEGVG